MRPDTRPDTLPVSRMRRKLERAKRQRNALAVRVRVLSEEKAALQSKIDQALSYVTGVDRYNDESDFVLRRRLSGAKYVLYYSSAKEEKRQKGISRIWRRERNRKAQAKT